MTSQEKEQLLALLLDARHWCQAAEARSADGQPVTYSDSQATAWDLTGAACRLFGWRRACQLFVQFDRYIHPRARPGLAGRDAEITAMVGLQNWNDDPQTTHAGLLERLERLPVSTRSGSGQGRFVAVSDRGPDGSGT